MIADRQDSQVGLPRCWQSQLPRRPLRLPRPVDLRDARPSRRAPRHRPQPRWRTRPHAEREAIAWPSTRKPASGTSPSPPARSHAGRQLRDLAASVTRIAILSPSAAPILSAETEIDRLSTALG